jgi:hypothetical protein
MQETAEPPSMPVLRRRAEPEIAPGLPLPSKGHAWALDASVGAQQFTQLRFSPTQLNNHRKQNVAKATLAPFAFKQKATVEVAGSTAKVRLRSSVPVFYVRSIYSVDDTNMDDEAYAEPHLALVKLEVQGDHRIASTIAFGRITQKPSRSEGVIETRLERIADTSWFKITPMEALAPGEYGLIPLPKTQNTFSTVILDFAIL